MSTPQVILASGSPRRLELLRILGLEPLVQPPDVDEAPLAGEAPEDHVGRLAAAKASAVTRGHGQLVIAADTVVLVDGTSLGKPQDDADARAMLHALSGRTHQVLTAVHLSSDAGEASELSRTDVTFRSLSAHEIDWYRSTHPQLDKAGAYGIQDGAGAFVSSISGSHSAVMGLPLAVTVRLAARLGVDLLTAD